MNWKLAGATHGRWLVCSLTLHWWFLLAFQVLLVESVFFSELYQSLFTQFPLQVLLTFSLLLSLLSVLCFLCFSKPLILSLSLLALLLEFPLSSLSLFLLFLLLQCEKIQPLTKSLAFFLSSSRISCLILSLASSSSISVRILCSLSCFSFWQSHGGNNLTCNLCSSSFFLLSSSSLSFFLFSSLSFVSFSCLSFLCFSSLFSFSSLCS